jgi:hypothetical protein
MSLERWKCICTVRWAKGPKMFGRPVENRPRIDDVRKQGVRVVSTIYLAAYVSSCDTTHLQGSN